MPPDHTPPNTRHPSPDGAYFFALDVWEARMSHWVETPALTLAATGAVLWQPADGNWSLSGAEWLDGQRVRLWLRKYPGAHLPALFEVRIDCAAGSAHLGEDGSAGIPLPALNGALEHACSEGQREYLRQGKGRWLP